MTDTCFRGLSAGRALTFFIAATWPMRTHALVSGPEPSPTANLMTRRCESLRSHAAQKNVLWRLRNDAPRKEIRSSFTARH